MSGETIATALTVAAIMMMVLVLFGPGKYRGTHRAPGAPRRGNGAVRAWLRGNPEGRK